MGAPKGPRRDYRRQQREAVLAVARDLIATTPYRYITTTEIAHSAHIAPRTLFRYFDSKDELILAACGVTEEALDDVSVVDRYLLHRVCSQDPNMFGCLIVFFAHGSRWQLVNAARVVTELTVPMADERESTDA